MENQIYNQFEVAMNRYIEHSKLNDESVMHAERLALRTIQCMLRIFDRRDIWRRCKEQYATTINGRTNDVATIWATIEGL